MQALLQLFVPQGFPVFHLSSLYSILLHLESNLQCLSEWWDKEPPRDTNGYREQNPRLQDWEDRWLCSLSLYLSLFDSVELELQYLELVIGPLDLESDTQLLLFSSRT